ncbi:hypothetical protein Fot_19286 [Forsythia ovata]|uniref:Uncharacterized protein n=1 Tax=Forsythia ovata TaxID=205694 RepID=A0ABD1VKM4_9LAMI
MTVHKRSHLSKNHFARAFILMQDQNRLCEDHSTKTERYWPEVREYKKKFTDLSSTVERREAKVERTTNELEELRKNPKSGKLKADVCLLANDLTASRTRAQETKNKIQQEVEKKREEIKMFYVQQKSWEEDLAKKDEELGVLNAKVESQDLALVEMSAKAGKTELLDLIRDEHLDFNFDFLYEEGETAALALPSENDDTEAAMELSASEVPEKSTTSEASPSEVPPSHGADPIVFEKLQDL